MDKRTIIKLIDSFNSIEQKSTAKTTAFWSARDLMLKLGYTKWQNFVEVVSKANTACQNSGVSSANHFVGVNKMVAIGSGAERTSEEYENLRSQFATLESQRGKHRKYLPYVFTEQGIAMLLGVLKNIKEAEVHNFVVNV